MVNIGVCGGLVSYLFVEDFKMGEIFRISGGIGEPKHNNNNLYYFVASVRHLLHL